MQWVSIWQFTDNVAKQIGESAFEVSRNTAETLIFEQPKTSQNTFAFSTNNQVIGESQVNQLLSGIKKDVTLQLVDEQKDDYLMLNADGVEYQIAIPRTGIHKALDEFSNNVFYSTIALLIFGVLMASYLTNKLATPLKKLQQVSKEVGEGNLGLQVDKDNQWHSKEIDKTLASFNLMSEKIAELQKQNTELQAKAHLAELAEISRGLAHSIRNPLNTLNLALDQLNTISADEDKSSLTHIAKQQIKRIDRWVRSLMDVMSDDENLIKQFSVNSILESVITDQKLANDKSLNFKIINQAENYRINLIESEFKGIISSLVSNAVEASPENAEITINLTKEKDVFCIQISDQGKGFSKQALKSLFMPHNTDKTYGAGMGLYLAHRIIKHKYAGDISIKNLKPKGSLVSVTFKQRQ